MHRRSPYNKDNIRSLYFFTDLEQPTNARFWDHVLRVTLSTLFPDFVSGVKALPVRDVGGHVWDGVCVADDHRMGLHL
jgi:hypothetical protein